MLCRRWSDGLSWFWNTDSGLGVSHLWRQGLLVLSQARFDLAGFGLGLGLLKGFVARFSAESFSMSLG